MFVIIKSNIDFIINQYPYINIKKLKNQSFFGGFNANTIKGTIFSIPIIGQKNEYHKFSQQLTFAPYLTASQSLFIVEMISLDKLHSISLPSLYLFKYILESVYVFIKLYPKIQEKYINDEYLIGLGNLLIVIKILVNDDIEA